MNNLQKRIVEKRTQKGFETDPLKIHILLTEEVGEVSSELKRMWSKTHTDFNKENLGDEIADVFVLLSALDSALASVLDNEFDIDVEESVEKKFFKKDSTQTWKNAPPTT